MSENLPYLAETAILLDNIQKLINDGSADWSEFWAENADTVGALQAQGEPVTFQANVMAHLHYSNGLKLETQLILRVDDGQISLFDPARQAQVIANALGDLDPDDDPEPDAAQQG